MKRPNNLITKRILSILIAILTCLFVCAATLITPPIDPDIVETTAEEETTVEISPANDKDPDKNHHK